METNLTNDMFYRDMINFFLLLLIIIVISYKYKADLRS